jgi:hypothetical protein
LLSTRYGENIRGGDSVDLVQEYDYDILRPLLTEYTTLLNDLDNQEYAQQRLNISKKMIMAPRLKAKGKFTKESRIEVAFGEAHSYLKEYGKSMEGISRVGSVANSVGSDPFFVCHYEKYCLQMLLKFIGFLDSGTI